MNKPNLRNNEPTFRPVRDGEILTGHGTAPNFPHLMIFDGVGAGDGSCVCNIESFHQAIVTKRGGNTKLLIGHMSFGEPGVEVTIQGGKVIYYTAIEEPNDEGGIRIKRQARDTNRLRYWIAVNGTSVTTTAVPMSEEIVANLKISPTPEWLMGFPTVGQASAAMEACLTDPMETLVKKIKDWADDPDNNIVLPDSPEQMTKGGVTVWNLSGVTCENVDVSVARSEATGLDS